MSRASRIVASAFAAGGVIAAAAVTAGFVYPAPPPPAIELEASAACVDNVPLITYNAEVTGVETQNPTATITIQETASGGRSFVVGSGLPLSGSFTWPGYSASPEAWPGWSVSNGVWVDGGDNTNLGWTRDAYLVVTVNPTATTAIQYPAESAACLPKDTGVIPDEQISTTDGRVPTDTTATPTLAVTGFTSMPLAVGGATLLVVGAGLVVVAARRTGASREKTDVLD